MNRVQRTLPLSPPPDEEGTKRKMAVFRLKMQSFRRKTVILRFEPSSGGLEAIGKRVVDFLLMITELFRCVCVIAEAPQAKIEWKSAFSKERRQ